MVRLPTYRLPVVDLSMWNWTASLATESRQAPLESNPAAPTDPTSEAGALAGETAVCAAARSK